MFTHVDFMINVHSEEREHHHKKSNMDIGLLRTKFEKTNKNLTMVRLQKTHV
jgi:hypothetical protein